MKDLQEPTQPIRTEFVGSIKQKWTKKWEAFLYSTPWSWPKDCAIENSGWVAIRLWTPVPRLCQYSRWRRLVMLWPWVCLLIRLLGHGLSRGSQDKAPSIPRCKRTAQLKVGRYSDERHVWYPAPYAQNENCSFSEAQNHLKCGWKIKDYMCHLKTSCGCKLFMALHFSPGMWDAPIDILSRTMINMVGPGVDKAGGQREE